MTTLKEAYDITMAMIDELDGVHADFEARTPGLVNAILGELYPYSDTYVNPISGKRAICGTVSGFDDALPLDDFLCRSVLPCALAARLLLDENPSVASYYERRSIELLGRQGNMHAAVAEPIIDVYGGIR